MKLLENIWNLNKIVIMKKLKLDYRNTFKETNTTFNLKSSNLKIMVTPPIDEDYWVFRIRLYKDQSIVAFPKFTTMGIGFAQEEDWNTNLPYKLEAEEICNHIWHNHKYEEITKEEVIEAINILKKACEYYMEYEYEPPKEKSTYEDFVAYEKRLKEFMTIK